MPLNDHNNIELVPTTTKVPVPFVVVFGDHFRPTMQEAAAGTIPAAASLGWQGPIAGVEGRF